MADRSALGVDEIDLSATVSAIACGVFGEPVIARGRSDGVRSDHTTSLDPHYQRRPASRRQGPYRAMIQMAAGNG
jgi:hypothetical protein